MNFNTIAQNLVTWVTIVQWVAPWVVSLVLEVTPVSEQVKPISEAVPHSQVLS